MDWKNAEHFDDLTAGTAICFAMIPDLRRSDVLDDESCRSLARAVVLQAVQDYRGLLAGKVRLIPPELSLEELEEFFRSDWCGLLGYSGRRILRLVRKEAACE